MKWKKKEKETKPNKVKKVRTMKVGTHKKSVIALWLVLIASVSFGVYKNFTAIDMHTVHEKEIIEQRIVDTNKIENFVKDFAKAYYTWSNTKEIFKEIINDFMSQQNDIFSEKIAKKQSAKKILEDVLEKYKVEMLDNQSSLSLAIYEYFSIKDNAETKNELYVQYLASFNAWQNLLEYGIKNGEFNNVDIKSVFDLIIFSYQGVRMYSKLMPIDEDIPQRIIEQIKKIIVKE